MDTEDRQADPAAKTENIHQIIARKLAEAKLAREKSTVPDELLALAQEDDADEEGVNDQPPEDAPPVETNRQKRQRRYEAEARARETATGGPAQVAPLDRSLAAAFNTPIDALVIPEPEMPPRVDGERVRTEALLNDLIGECHFLMRETAFRSICQCTDPGDRRSFMSSAMEFAKTGAEVAGSIARLQGGNAPVVNQTRQLISVEYLEKTPRGEGGGVAP